MRPQKKGQYDGLMGAYYDQKRTQYFRYTDPIMENKDVFIGLKNGIQSYKELNELKAYRIGVIRGASYADELIAQGFTVVEANDDLQSLRMLLKERLDLVLMSQTHFKYLLKNQDDLSKSQTELVILEQPFRVVPLYCLISLSRDDNKEIVERFNQALESLKENGSWDKILERYSFLSSEG